MNPKAAGAWMHISRRNFLHGMTASAGTLWSSRVTGLDNLAGRQFDCVVLDLTSHCVLGESLQGYQAAFADEHHCLAADRLDSRWRCRMVIARGVGMMDPAIGRMLLELVQGGTRLVLESGAGFLSPAETAAHQRMLFRCFELEVSRLSICGLESLLMTIFSPAAAAHIEERR